MIFRKPESVEAADAGIDAGLEDVLRDFRSSVHAWSKAEFGRPRTVQPARGRHAWRMASAWALGCVLAAGSLSVGLHQYEHHRQLARIAAQHAQEQRQLAAAQAAAQARIADDKLMAAVDKDVSEEVPSAMEPLARLMDDGAGQ